MSRFVNELGATIEASSDCLCMTRHSKKRSKCCFWDCTIGGIDLTGEQSHFLYRSRSLPHWIGLAEGTHPQPTPTGIKTGSRRLTDFLRATGPGKRSRRANNLIENARRAGPANSSPEPTCSSRFLASTTSQTQIRSADSPGPPGPIQGQQREVEKKGQYIRDAADVL